MRLSIVIPSPVFFFFFWKVTRTRNSAIAGKCVKKNQKNWRNLSLHSLQLLNHLKEFLFPPFFSLSRDIVAQVEREGKGGEMFCPSAATAAYPRWCTEYQIQQTLGLDQRETVLTCTRIVTGRARRFKRPVKREKSGPVGLFGIAASRVVVISSVSFSPFLFSPYRRSCWTERKRNNSLISPLLPLDPSITGQISRISSRAVVPHPLLFADCLRIEHRLLPALLRRN